MLPLPRFDYAAPERLEDALGLLADAGSMPVAGGTDFVPSAKHRLFRPERVVSLRRVRGLRDVDAHGDGLRLGAGLTLREVARAVRARWPALADACETVGTPTIQAMGTLGGNLALDTRCIYYNQPAGWRKSVGYCLKREGTVCHVAPRGTGCYAAHSADTVPALWLYGAEVEIASTAGSRRVALRDLYGDDGISPLRLQRGELLTAIWLPAPRGPIVHRKLRTRGAIDYALLLVAVAREEGGLRAVISAVGPSPVEVSASTVGALADAAHSAVQPLGTHLAAPTWRKRMIRVEVTRAAIGLHSGPSTVDAHRG